LFFLKKMKKKEKEKRKETTREVCYRRLVG